MQAPGLPPLYFLYSLKSTSSVDFLEAAASVCGEELPPSVAHFFQSLSTARSKVLEYIKPPQDGCAEKVEEVDAALSGYLSRINYLLLPKPGTNGRQDGVGGLTLQGLVHFTWTSVLGGGAVSGNDVRFEIASVLLSVAFWKARTAAQCAGCTPYVSDDQKQTLSLPYRLFREAAGLVEHVLRVTNLIKESPAIDCRQQTLHGLLKCLLADAESLTVLRAIAHKNAESLIAHLAYDVQDLYQESVSELKSGGAQAQEFLLYLEYKAASFKSIAYSFQSAVHLGKMEGGLAVRFAHEAKKECESSHKLKSDLDQKYLVTCASSTSEFQASLMELVDRALEKAETDNTKVYYQRVPPTIPEMNKERRVFPIAFEFPVPDPSIDRAQALSAKWKDVSQRQSTFEVSIDLKNDKKNANDKPSNSAEGSDHAWRWLLVIMVAPVLFVISLLGIIVWIFLLPVKLFCCPAGCAAQIVWNIMEWIVKAPLRVSLWAAGEPWKPADKKSSESK